MGTKPSKPFFKKSYPLSMPTNEVRIKDGERFLSVIWSVIAEQVVETAIQVYELSPDQATALRQAFLRGVTFAVEGEL
jgi:hypothetical protein